MDHKPAILGGKPAFESRIPMVRPVLPAFPEMEDGIRYILSSGMVTRGKYLAAFEEAVAGHLGVRHALAVSSCTSGLMLSYKSLGLEGDVVVPSFTFMATVSAMTWCGLKPVFADVDAATMNLDPAAAEAAITPATSAIVAVHNFGNPAPVRELEAIASKHGLKLVFDAAHGFGALYEGAPVGAQGNAQSFSMSPTKLLITGEGGLVSTGDDDLAEKIRIGREYGNDGSYDTVFPGLNARMPELNALMGLYSLKNLETAAANRNQTAALLHEHLGALPGIGFQSIRPQNRSSYREFAITIDAQAYGVSRDHAALALAAENIDSRKYYQPAVHCQTAYRPYFDGHPLPNTDFLAANSLSLPMWSKMEPEVVLGICDAFRRIHSHAKAVSEKLS